jgi:2-hydroxychromene-2-carboxylate isomerase
VPQQLAFWFEFASTYSYLSAMRIDDEAARRGVSVIWQPFLLGPIFKAQGLDSSSFIIHEAKGLYMWRDIERRAAALGLPLHRPQGFPQNSLLAARTAISALSEDWGRAYCRNVYSAQFAEGKDISDPAVIAECVEDAGGVAPIHLFSGHSNAQKQTLREQVAWAENLGIFGAPSFTVGDELFWGDDRLEDALDWAARP